MASQRHITNKPSGAALSEPLKGYRIKICGEYKDKNHTHTSLKELINKKGGDTHQNLKSDTNYIFATETAFKSSSKVITNAIENGLTIIDTSWLIKAGCKRSELHKYYLHPPSQKHSGTIEDSYGTKVERKLPHGAREEDLEYIKSRDNHAMKKDKHIKGTGYKAVVTHKPNGILKKPVYKTPGHDIARHVGFINNEKLFLAPPVPTLPEPVRKVMKLIFNQTNAANVKDGYKKSWPSCEGGISKSSLGWQEEKNLEAGFKCLLKVRDCIYQDDQKGISFQNGCYNSVIPSGHRGGNPLINDMERLNKEWERLRNSMYLPERQLQDLNLKEMAPLDKDSEEFKYLQRYLNVSGGATYKLENIFRIERKGEHEKFQEYVSDLQNENRRLLWHGSPVANYSRIMSKGLEIGPDEVTISGYNFGRGVYLFEMSSQAANYCDYKASQGEALLLLCEAALGYPFNKITKPSDSDVTDIDDTTCSDSDVLEKKPKTTCCQGKNAFKRFTKPESLRGVKIPNTKFEPEPTKVQDALLDYNVFICGKVAQVKLRYLVHVRIPT
ncbi:poly polymerase [Fusarium mundagurra]|uniref:Poly [ADP-ribose] polymerase n=1 Tax=Fusarium mundagurra TaxID=1567541 RepID=A0A8H6D9R7_9HYPO|nr:poly polymerase [Fusarium mundagurra]